MHKIVTPLSVHSLRCQEVSSVWHTLSVLKVRVVKQVVGLTIRGGDLVCLTIVSTKYLCMAFYKWLVLDRIEWMVLIFLS